MKKFLVLFIMIFIVSSVHAIEDIKLTMSEAQKFAIENNLELKAIREDIKKAENNVKIAKRFQNPNIGTQFFMGKAGVGNPTQLGPSLLIEIAKRGARKNVALADLEIIKQTVALSEFKIKLNVRSTYIKLLYAKTVYKELEEQKKFFEDLRNIVLLKVKNHTANEMDIIQTDIILNRITADLNDAIALLEEAENNFNDTLNFKNYKYSYNAIEDTLPNNNNFENLLTPPLAYRLGNRENIISQVIDNRFDLKIAKQNIDYAQKNLIATKRKIIPDIELMGGYAYQSKKISEEGIFKSGAYIGANIVNLPIFYNYSPEIRNAAIEVVQAKIKYDSLMVEALNDTNSAYEKFNIAQRNLIAYDKNNILKKSKELMKLSKEKYKQDKFDLTALIVMEQSYREIIFDYANILEKYYLSWLEFLTQTQNEDFDITQKI